METFLQDFRYGLRVLYKAPGFTAVAVIALALGIGANTAIFSVVNAVLLRKLPFKEQDRLVAIYESRKANPKNVVGPMSFMRWRDRSKSFDQMAGIYKTEANLTGSGTPERLPVTVVSANYFSMLGVQPILGRALTGQDEQQGHDNVVVLSKGLWERKFGADPNIVGKTITVDGRPQVVLGVMPPDFQVSAKTAMWTPLVLTEKNRTSRGRFMTTLAHLKPGVSLQQAKSEMNVIAKNIEAEIPENNRGWGVTVVPLREQLVGNLRRALLVLLAAVTFVLLIACANVASLQLARASAREKEIAIRAALGVSQMRLIRQLLTESLTLALMGGVAGVVLAFWGMKALVAAAPTQVPGFVHIGLDGQVLAFTLLVSLLTGIGFGLIPAWHSAKVDPHEALKDGGKSAGTGSIGKRKMHNALVLAESALAFVLLVAAGLMLKSFAALMAVDPGFDPTNVITLEVNLPQAKYPTDPKQTEFFEKAVAGIQQIPGVQSAAAISYLPLNGPAAATSFEIEGHPKRAVGEEAGGEVRSASADYFRTMGIPIVKGRSFDPSQEKADDKIKKIVISENAAQTFWPGEDPIGKMVSMEWFGMMRGQVVGIVRDIKLSELGGTPKPILYWYMPQFPYSAMTLIAKTTGGQQAMALVPAIRTQIAAIDPDQPISSVRTMDEVIAESVREPKFTVLLLFTFAVTALILTSVGIYGVISYFVNQRTHEIGVRMALGAQSQDIFGLVMSRGVFPALAGIAIGIVGAIGLTHFMRSLLFNVSATDPMIFAGLAALLGAVAVVASFVPALRATRVDPMVALRNE